MNQNFLKSKKLGEFMKKKNIYIDCTITCNVIIFN